MRVPKALISTNFLLTLTHAISGTDGVLNASFTIPIDKTKYLSGGSLIDCLPDTALPDFKTNINDYVNDI